MPKGRAPALFVLAGQRFGRGVVTDPEIRVRCTAAMPKGVRGARLLCDCGTVYEAPVASLLRTDKRDTTSCGCAARELASAWCRSAEKRRITSQANRVLKLKHGLSRHELYDTWWQMVNRCENPAGKNWAHYGARGISVCQDWHDPAVFIPWILANLGPRPPGKTLDRIDNDGDYEPGNVRWATQSEQVRNSRRRR
jgi:hypothetical protein